MFYVSYHNPENQKITSPVFHVRDVMTVKQSGLNIQNNPVPVILTEFLVYDLTGKFCYVNCNDCLFIETP
jgi:hypothetical protein